ncbi:hypothetical protein CKO44_18715 [Rubrivivax gelatinosus]|uniref:Uncharacterized protein n=1 Tax=Rubrivivax gelatinosus TaxID=28068 RepID=A0ABS1DTU7_RUBGE|nr:hypothetical protein [Rubrivivax gelatinosus]MBK1615497.1 hypothetical protein [Rubrivivax gelatinosus]MBK1713099.1 hypothetical protein [Rubrivivax gelatinosus]
MDDYLVATGAEPVPTATRKLLWLWLDGDKLPDALVVLRTRRDECAVVATGPRPCRALVLAAEPGGGYRVAAEFTLRTQPVALRREGAAVRGLYYSRDTGAHALYGQYRYDGRNFGRVDGELDEAGVNALPVLLADDRSMSAWDDQSYAARQFPNDRARLAPFRLHYDEQAFAAFRRDDEVEDARYGERVRALTDALVPDAQTLAEALPWPHTLEMRLWACGDWMVPRRFWEVEDRRLGRLGTCVDGAIFAVRQRLVASGTPLVDLVRLPLLQQAGIAWRLRVAADSPQNRAQLRAADAATLLFQGSVAATLLGHQLRLLPLERAAGAITTLRQGAERWFEVVESGREHFVSPTPELRAYSQDLDVLAAAHQCARRTLGQPPARGLGPACDGARLETARRVASLLQEDMSR